MVGPCGLEPQTSTVSTDSLQVKLFVKKFNASDEPKAGQRFGFCFGRTNLRPPLRVVSTARGNSEFSNADPVSINHLFSIKHTKDGPS